MTPHAASPLLWDGDRFRPVTDLHDLTEWDEEPPERTQG